MYFMRSRSCHVTALVLVLSGPCAAHDVPAAAPVSAAAAQPAPGATLFQDVRVFDGKSSTLSGPTNVLVRGNTIERVSGAAVTVDASVKVIAGAGRTLMPGLIDMHWHTMLVRPTPAAAIAADIGYNNIVASAEVRVAAIQKRIEHASLRM